MRYKYKDKEYIVIHRIKSKHPQTREWYDAIAYASADQKNIYSREEKEFYELFKLV